METLTPMAMRPTTSMIILEWRLLLKNVFMLHPVAEKSLRRALKSKCISVRGWNKFFKGILTNITGIVSRKKAHGPPAARTRLPGRRP